MVYAPGGAFPVAAIRSAGGDEADRVGGAAAELSGPTTGLPRSGRCQRRGLTYAGRYLHNAGVGDGDTVFKALADPTRRALLDRLRERNGQTLGELCEPLAMARQSATQHLGVLEQAGIHLHPS